MSPEKKKCHGTVPIKSDIAKKTFREKKKHLEYFLINCLFYFSGKNYNTPSNQSN